MESVYSDLRNGLNNNSFDLYLFCLVGVAFGVKILSR